MLLFGVVMRALLVSVLNRNKMCRSFLFALFQAPTCHGGFVGKRKESVIQI